MHSHAHTHAGCLFLSLALAPALAFPLSLSLSTHTHTQTLSLSHTHTYTHRYAPPEAVRGDTTTAMMLNAIQQRHRIMTGFTGILMGIYYVYREMYINLYLYMYVCI